MSDAPIVVFQIFEYMVIFRQLEERDFDGITAKIRGIVRCTGKDPRTDEDYRLEVFFLTLDSDFPAPVVDLENKHGAIFMHIAELPALVDILRNEKPIFGHLRGDNPQWTSITTTNEPVGTGDEDYEG